MKFHHDQNLTAACVTQSGSQGESVCFCAPFGAKKLTDDGWSTPCGAPPPLPRLPSSPRSSWQPYTNLNVAQRPWVFHFHVQEPPYEPVTLNPVIPEIIRPIQYGSTPRRLLLTRSDIEILTLFDDDTSYIRETRISILTWNPGPRRGTAGANERHIYRKLWTICSTKPSQTVFTYPTSLAALSCSTNIPSTLTCG